jgi:hypothetical protein
LGKGYTLLMGKINDHELSIKNLKNSKKNLPSLIPLYVYPSLIDGNICTQPEYVDAANGGEKVISIINPSNGIGKYILKVWN